MSGVRPLPLSVTVFLHLTVVCGALILSQPKDGTVVNKTDPTFPRVQEGMWVTMPVRLERRIVSLGSQGSDSRAPKSEAQLPKRGRKGVGGRKGHLETQG